MGGSAGGISSELELWWWMWLCCACPWLALVEDGLFYFFRDMRGIDRHHHHLASDHARREAVEQHGSMQYGIAELRGLTGS